MFPTIVAAENVGGSRQAILAGLPSHLLLFCYYTRLEVQSHESAFGIFPRNPLLLPICLDVRAGPNDAKGLMRSALTGTDPVIFFESQRIYDQPELFHGPEGVPADSYTITLGEPEVKRAGTDLTILTIGATLYRALEAADILQSEHNISCEVIDARTIVPFNYAPVLESVKKTGKILLASDACERGSILQTMATKIAQFAFDELDGPPVVVGARNWITPADEVEDAFFPFPSDILDAIHEHILPLNNYTTKRV